LRPSTGLRALSWRYRLYQRPAYEQSAELTEARRLASFDERRPSTMLCEPDRAHEAFFRGLRRDEPGLSALSLAPPGGAERNGRVDLRGTREGNSRASASPPPPRARLVAQKAWKSGALVLSERNPR